jgi:hypothetical protein
VKRETIDSVLGKLSYRVSSQKMLVELSFSGSPLFVIHLGGIKTFIDALFEPGKQEPRIQQVANAFLELYRQRYPTVKRGLKDFDTKERLCFTQLIDLMDQLRTKYPDFNLNYRRYLYIHFKFYSENFNTAPKPSYFVTDNAVRRTDELIQHFDAKWPGDEKIDTYFKEKPSKAGPKAIPDAVKAKPSIDIRLTGLQVWTTNVDAETPLKDNARFQSMKSKVLHETATLYEARYVRDCYLIRNSADTMSNSIEGYIEKLEALAVELGVKLK